jgi:hypothetical protein
MFHIDNAMEATTMEAKTKTRRHLGAQAWSEVFARFDGSGESVTGFCKREGLHTSSFRRWQRRLAGKAATADTTQARKPREATHQASAPSFIEVGAMDAASKSVGRLEVRLELGDGLVLQLVRG